MSLTRCVVQRGPVWTTTPATTPASYLPLISLSYSTKIERVSLAKPCSSGGQMASFQEAEPLSAIKCQAKPKPRSEQPRPQTAATSASTDAVRLCLLVLLSRLCLPACYTVVVLVGKGALFF
jgi:hypothetical protein